MLRRFTKNPLIPVDPTIMSRSSTSVTFRSLGIRGTIQMLQLSLAGATIIGGLRMPRTISPVKRLHGEQRGNAVKRFCWLSKVAAFLLLNILCWTKSLKPASVNSASLNFGSVQAGNATAQSLVLSNSSKSDLTVSQAIVAGRGAVCKVHPCHSR